MVPMLHLNENVYLDEKDTQRANEYARLKSKSFDEARQTVIFQKAQFTAEKLAILLQTGKLEKYNTENLPQDKVTFKNYLFQNEVLKPLGIKESSDITYEDVKTIFRKAYAKHKLGLAVTCSIPGPKMVFQCDENADLTPFRFFRQFDSIKYEPYLYTEKGYKPGKPALEASTLGTINYSTKGKIDMTKFRNLSRDLNMINAENPALTKGVLIAENTVKTVIAIKKANARITFADA